MKYKSLISKIQELAKEGIARGPDSFSFITQYPPPRTLPEISSESITQKEGLDLYVHIPFCTGKCGYCKFYSLLNQESETIDKYIRDIKRETQIYLDRTDLRQKTIDTLYLGGGTPSYLSPNQLRGLVDFLFDNLSINKNGELTSETSPETISEKILERLLELNFNRISIGVQDFNDDILVFIGRRHTAKQAIESFNLAREKGFRNINLDLIYGLPNQTLDKWRYNLETIAELRPESVTTYRLRREKSTLIGSLDESAFPQKEDITKMYFEGLERLIEMGYIQIAPNQFILPEKTFKQQENKWKFGKELIGLGASAYSFFNGFVYYNARSIKDYGKLVKEGKLPVWIGKEVSAKELMRRTLIFGLKTSGINREDNGLDKKMFEERFGITAESFFGVELERLRKLGLIEDNGNFIKLSLTGLVLSEEVCRELYSPEIKTQLDKIGDKFGRSGL